MTSDSERNELFKEALLLVLARAAHSDTSVRPVEVETVRRIVLRQTGDDVSDADVRVASKSELYERASLTSYLSKVSRNLTPSQRSTIVRCLHEVIQSDCDISEREIDFFNQVVSALQATPAEIVGLLDEE